MALLRCGATRCVVRTRQPPAPAIAKEQGEVDSAVLVAGGEAKGQALVELVGDKTAARGIARVRVEKSVAPRHQRGQPAVRVRFECLAGAHNRAVALVRYRDHVAGGLQACTERVLLTLHILAIDGRGVLLQPRHVAVDGEPAAFETRVVLRQPQVEVDGGRVRVDTDARGVGVAG